MGNENKKPVPEPSASDKMFDMIFEFKMMSKSFKKEALKSENQEKQFVLKVKEAIEKNLPETAKIHAADAIRKKTEARRYLLLSSKLEAVQQRIQTAYQTQRVKFILIIIIIIN
jgi:charged multivesicular body protein 1